MMIKITNLELTLEEEKSDLKGKAAKLLRIPESEILSLEIQKESIDARKEPLKFVHTVHLTVKDEELALRKNRSPKVSHYAETIREPLTKGNMLLKHRPVVVGLGPAGLFAALKLAEEGYCPLVLERGAPMKERDEKVDFFMKTGILDVKTNIQFGEGGAGAYSDGKLTTRIKDPRIHEVIDMLLSAGAPEEIAYLSKPHVGTDLLKEVVVKIRERIKEQGGEVRFYSQMENLKIKDGALKEITVNGEPFETEVMILALGHSARDTYETLFSKGITMEAKSMAVGVRIENLQWRISESQYGPSFLHPKLRPAEYTLAAKTRDGRGVYSFCMCPGGLVVPAASEEGHLVVNGMSYHARDKENANSALVVSVTPDDYGSHPLAGIAFQRNLEKKAFQLGGGSYHAPVQKVEDFLEGKLTETFGEVQPSYEPGVKSVFLKELFPSYITEGLEDGLLQFEKKIEGFTKHGALLTGVETRTSAPVRILRGDTLESPSAEGLYPCGEGAGYAGGIVSSAVDGIKVAEAVIRKYKPMK